MKQQKSMSGKTRSERFHVDDEGLILRKEDGINEYFGNKNINDITTYDLRDYLTVLMTIEIKDYLHHQNPNI